MIRRPPDFVTAIQNLEFSQNGVLCLNFWRWKILIGWRLSAHLQVRRQTFSSEECCCKCNADIKPTAENNVQKRPNLLQYNHLQYDYDSSPFFQFNSTDYRRLFVGKHFQNTKTMRLFPTDLPWMSLRFLAPKCKQASYSGSEEDLIVIHSNLQPPPMIKKFPWYLLRLQFQEVGKLSNLAKLGQIIKNSSPKQYMFITCTHT